MDYTKINSETIDNWIKDGWEWGTPISHEEFEEAKNSRIIKVKLTPTKFVPQEWLGDIKDKKILGLACGGAQQMPIFTALGAECTVLDYSDKQLESESMVAKREGYKINIIKADMTKALPFEDESFDIIFNPVSNCYVEDVKPIWRECYRILKNYGILMSGFDYGLNYIFDNDEKYLQNSLPFNPLKNKEHLRQLQEQDAGIQFSHTLEEQLNGQLEAGFILTHLYDDTNGYGNLHKHNIPSYMASRSMKELLYKTLMGKS